MGTIDLPLNETTQTGKIASWRDWAGIVASVGCAIHCAAMPFVFAYLPALGLSFLADESFHKWMALICFVIAIGAFLPGIRKHKSWLPISVGAGGLALITYAAFGLAGECCASCDGTMTEVAAASNCQSCAGCETGAGCESVTGCAECDADNTFIASPECENCAECASGSSPDASKEFALTDSSSAGAEKGLLARLAPWLTPLGGLLLVSAHLLNRHLGCRCSCCGTNAVAT